MAEAVILKAVRTPFGRRGGALRSVHPYRLLAHTLSRLVDRAGIEPGEAIWLDGTIWRAPR